jgi:hypothetical protein
MTTTKAPSEAAFRWAVDLTVLVGEAANTPPGVVADQLLLLAGMDAASTSKYIDTLQQAKSALPKPAYKHAVLAYVPPAGQYLVNGEHLTLKASKMHGGMLVYEKYSGYMGALASPKCAAIAEALGTAEKAQAACIAYAKATSKCGVCNTPLKDPKSIADGIGPVCKKKFA